MSRRKAREGLIAFTEYTNPDYVCADHHKLIANHLEAVERGDLNRLMIFMPPRHGKSELASRRFPAYYLGKGKNRQVIAASYNSDLANDFGRDVRNVVASYEYSLLFDTALRADSKAADRWNTNGGGAYIAAGVGTSMTGRGAHLGIIDDPIKDRQEAESETVRERLHNWYKSTFRTRLMPGGSILLIQTRWHDDDLAGRILNSPGADEWTVLELAARADGRALWPAWYPLEELERIERDIGPREWSALYQQQPQPDEGTYFQRDWFHIYRDQALPEVMNVYGTSDYAVSDGGGDYTEHSVWGIGYQGIFLLDNWHGQTTSDVWIEKKLDLIDKYKPLAWFGEAGVIKKAVEPFLLRRMRERNTHCRIEWLPSITDKPTRARAIQSRAAMREVWLPDTEAGSRALDQLLRFPAGKHDDFVDTASLLGMAIDQAHPAIVPMPELRPKRDRWDKLFENPTANSWKTV